MTEPFADGADLSWPTTEEGSMSLEDIYINLKGIADDLEERGIDTTAIDAMLNIIHAEMSKES